jgi:hypothetical protein
MSGKVVPSCNGFTSVFKALFLKIKKFFFDLYLRVKKICKKAMLTVA